MYNLQFHLPTHMHINAAIESDDGRSEKGDVRENMHMTNNLATSCKKRAYKIEEEKYIGLTEDRSND